MCDPINVNWISKQPNELPDFIIGGAMKSGTTTLHAILDQHPDIAIAREEIGFFDIDSIIQHSDFNFFQTKTKTWITQSINQDPELFWNWYLSKFSNKKKIKGEDSTTYLASKLAAKRIAMQKKAIKLIFILRHPTHRTISNYLHSLKSGRAIYSLEDTLRYQPHSIIQRSLYKEHLENYYKYIPHNRIKIVLFEDFIEDPKSCIKEVCEFINVDFNAFDENVFSMHSNKTKTPKNIKLQLIRNKLLRYYGNYRYSEFLPIQPKSQKKIPIIHKVINKIHNRINPHKSNYKYVPEPETVKFLDTYFKTEFQGIDALTKKDIYLKWF